MNPSPSTNLKARWQRLELLPHEVFFGLFLVITWLRSVAVLGFFSSVALLYFVLIWLDLAAMGYCRSGSSPGRWRIGLLFYPIAMNVIFQNMKVAIPRLHPGRLDGALQEVDSACIGRNLSLRLEPWANPVATELFSFCYFLFFLYLLFSLLYYFCSELSVLKKFIIGLFSIYGIGFLGYSFVPAAGPYVAMAGQFHTPLIGWWFTKWNAAIVARGSNGVDVFPSLHCAISCFFLFFDRRHRPWRFRLYVAPCIGLWLSTIYLRYHYLVDVVCGFALAAFALWLANRYPRSPASTPLTQELPSPKTLETAST